eukprot:SAG11_NODE_4106_length_2062_cov_4.083036_2_plen_164_part_00
MVGGGGPVGQPTKAKAQCVSDGARAYSRAAGPTDRSTTSVRLHGSDQSSTSAQQWHAPPTSAERPSAASSAARHSLAPVPAQYERHCSEVGDRLWQISACTVQSTAGLLTASSPQESGLCAVHVSLEGTASPQHRTAFSIAMDAHDGCTLSTALADCTFPGPT